MIITGLSDIHGQTGYIDRMAQILGSADLVVLAGDITHFEGISRAGRVLETVRRHAPRVLAVSGNCDEPGVDNWLIDQGVGLHAKFHMVNGLAFAGLGGSVFTPFHTPNEYTEARARQFLDKAVSGLDANIPLVVLSHQPPANTRCDRIRSGKHVGSRALREFIEVHQPLVCVTGHIHEAAATDEIGVTKIINPGPLWRGGYAHVTIESENAQVMIRRL
jgi:Icc-related predicted phosphoesterase